MNTDFCEQLPVQTNDRAQIWIIGTRDQVVHLMNEFYVKRIAYRLRPVHTNYSRSVCDWEIYDRVSAVGMR